MHERKKSVSFLIWVVSFAGTAFGQVTGGHVESHIENLEAANIAWIKVYEPVDGMNLKGAVEKYSWGTEKYWEWRERERAQVMKRGLEAWRSFPEDARRYHWLEDIISDRPLFWRDLKQGAASYARRRHKEALIDVAGWRTWRMEFTPLRAALLYKITDDQMSLSNRRELIYRDLQDEILATTYLQSQGVSVDYSILTKEVVDYCASVASTYSSNTGKLLVANVSEWLDPTAQRALADALACIPNVDMQIFAAGLHQQWKLNAEPLDLKVSGISGGTIDLAMTRNKLVLVDIWSTNCSSCIEAMPGIQSVYAKYRADGFEVIGICMSPEANRKAAAEAILKKNGVTYPNAFVAGEDYALLKRKYSIMGFPVTWLFGKNGKLLSRVVSERTLEERVRSELGLGPHEK